MPQSSKSEYISEQGRPTVQYELDTEVVLCHFDHTQLVEAVTNLSLSSVWLEGITLQLTTNRITSLCSVDVISNTIFLQYPA